MTRRSTDQRRRRVVIDGARKPLDNPNRQAVSRSGTRESGRSSSRDYSPSAARQLQLRTSDLIPRQWLSIGWIALSLVILMAVVSGLARLSIVNDWQLELPRYDRLSAYSMVGSHGLTAWVTSFLLILSSLASLQVYALRQHRRNDYRGTYRVWLWFAAFLLLASINCIVDIESAGREILRLWNPQASSSNPVWPLAFKLGCLGLLVVRGIIEVRSSPMSIALVVLVWLAYSLAIAVQIPAVENAIVFEQEPTYGHSLLLGSICVLLTTIVYARFVLLQSMGLIASTRSQRITGKAKSARVKTAKSKSRGKSKEIESDAAAEESDEELSDEQESESESDESEDSEENESNAVKPTAPAAGRPGLVSATGNGPLQSRLTKTAGSSPPPAAELSEDEDEETEASESQRPLSKAERRKLRKAQTQQRRAA